MVAPIILVLSLATLVYMFAVALRRKMYQVEKIHELSLPAYEMVERFKFFQGKNLDTFSRLLHANNFTGIEQLTREKFEAQGKKHPQEMAQDVLKKLIGSRLV